VLVIVVAVFGVLVSVVDVVVVVAVLHPLVVAARAAVLVVFYGVLSDLVVCH